MGDGETELNLPVFCQFPAKSVKFIFFLTFFTQQCAQAGDANFFRRTFSKGDFCSCRISRPSRRIFSFHIPASPSKMESQLSHPTLQGKFTIVATSPHLFKGGNHSFHIPLISDLPNPTMTIINRIHFLTEFILWYRDNSLNLNQCHSGYVKNASQAFFGNFFIFTEYRQIGNFFRGESGSGFFKFSNLPNISQKREDAS